jgi:hypothetical protein
MFDSLHWPTTSQCGGHLRLSQAVYTPKGAILDAADEKDSSWQVSIRNRFLEQCLAGLEAVPQAGLVHRGLKPATSCWSESLAACCWPTES